MLNNSKRDDHGCVQVQQIEDHKGVFGWFDVEKDESSFI